MTLSPSLKRNLRKSRSLLRSLLIRKMLRKMLKKMRRRVKVKMRRHRRLRIRKYPRPKLSSRYLSQVVIQTVTDSLLSAKNPQQIRNRSHSKQRLKKATTPMNLQKSTKS